MLRAVRFCVLLMSEIEWQTVLRKTGLDETVKRKTSSFCRLRERIKGSLLGEELFVYDHGKRQILRRKRESVVLDAREKGETKQENDGTVMLGLHGLLMRLLALLSQLRVKMLTSGQSLLFSLASQD